MLRNATAVVLALTITSLVSAEESPRFTAVIADLRGPVTVLHEPTGETTDGSIGRRLQVGDTVQTGEGAAATIFLSGGQLLEVLEGSRIRVTKDLHAESGSAKRLASMSRSSLRILERGVWIMSDPGGSRLVGGLRGSAPPEARPGMSGILPLSPRHEVVLDTRPAFYWTGTDRAVRVVVATETRVSWRSAAAVGSVRPSHGERALDPGSYTWWIETADTSRPLSPKVPFEVADQTVIAGAAALEDALDRAGMPEADRALPGFLRCAYYLEVGAWSPVLLDAAGVDPHGPEGVHLERCARAARTGMGLDERQQEVLLELAAHSLRRGPS